MTTGMELVEPLEPNGEESALARARLHRQLTVEETARRAGISVEQVRWLEEGRVYRFARPDDALAATYGGVRLHPVLLARNVWDAVPEAGLRALPAELVPCDDLSPPGDVDFADQAEGGHAEEQNDYGHGAR